MNRREFMIFSSAILATGAVKPAVAGADIKQLGVQFFSIPKLLEADFRQAISFLAGLGYSEVEFYGPYPFSAPESIAHWASITPKLGFSGSGFFGLSAQQARSVLTEHRMTTPSMHTDLLTLQTRMGELAEAAHTLGATYVTLPAIPAQNRKSLDDYERMADSFNAIGEQARRKGLKFAYHNHGYGLQAVQGQIPLKLMLQRTDPGLVFLEMDIFWTAAAGVDPIEYLKEYPSRYRLMHVKDMKEHRRFKGDGGDPDQWIELFPYMTSAGDGVLDIKPTVAQARQAGVEHFIVEQDMVADPQVALRRSADYLLTL
jgi:sugar phosphate isomerase/epimerase